MHERRPHGIPALALGTGALAALLLSGCVENHYHYPPTSEPSAPSVVYYGPPTSASHGYVYHYYEHDVSLVYDARWGGYWVRDYPDEYFYRGVYYRWTGGRWHRG